MIRCISFSKKNAKNGTSIEKVNMFKAFEKYLLPSKLLKNELIESSVYLVTSSDGNLSSKLCCITSSFPSKIVVISGTFVQQRLSDKLYGIHKVHANYARVFHEWSLIEKDISQPLQSAGHYMDV